MIAGIDYSITSPAICVHPWQDEWEPSKCRFLFFSQLKKMKSGDIVGDVFQCAKKVANDERMVRYSANAHESLKFLSQHEVKYVNIEGYAFAARSSMAMQMGENGGLLRSGCINHGMPYIETPPSRIKKYATGNGRSDKLAIIDKFKAETGYNLYKIFNRTAASSPIDDIADAYFICKYLHDNINTTNTDKEKLL